LRSSNVANDGVFRSTDAALDGEEGLTGWYWG